MKILNNKKYGGCLFTVALGLALLFSDPDIGPVMGR